MNQTELNAYKAMLEAKQAELAEALRHSEEVDRRGDSPAKRVNFDLPEAAYEDRCAMDMAIRANLRYILLPFFAR